MQKLFTVYVCTLPTPTLGSRCSTLRSATLRPSHSEKHRQELTRGQCPRRATRVNTSEPERFHDNVRSLIIRWTSRNFPSADTPNSGTNNKIYRIDHLYSFPAVSCDSYGALIEFINCTTLANLTRSHTSSPATRRRQLPAAEALHMN